MTEDYWVSPNAPKGELLTVHTARVLDEVVVGGERAHVAGFTREPGFTRMIRAVRRQDGVEVQTPVAHRYLA